MAQRAALEPVRRINRIPPHNLDAEQSVLGAMLESKDAIASVVEILKPEDFYKPAHGQIFEIIIELYGHGEPADAITVADELARRGMLDSIGGKPYILGLLEAYPTASSAARYAKIVDEHALLRKLIEAGNTIQEIGFSMPEDVNEGVDKAEQMIYEVGERRLNDDLQPLRGLLGDTMIELEKRVDLNQPVTGIASGFHDLDEITLGFQPASLIIVAARPSMGKSSLLGDFALSAAVRQAKPVVLFSLEMGRYELTQRFLASEARVDSQKLRRGNLHEQDWTRLSAALGRLAEAPIFIDDSASITLMEMRAKCRRLKARHGLGLVIIDYLQLMQSPRRSENRQQEVSEISRSLKILSKELNIPVLCASQLNRGVESRTDKRPFLGDLRESGCLTGDTLVTLSSGLQVPIEDLVGMTPRVASLDGWKMGSAPATKVWRTGHRPIFRLTTRTGRSIRATTNHPFRMLDGWRPLGDLRPGDRIAIPRRLCPDGTAAQWPSDRLVLLGHLIGDGCYASRQPLHYTTASIANARAVEAAAANEFGVRARWVRQQTWWHLYLSAGANKWHPNPIRAWLRDLGIDGQRSKEKSVPPQVFALPREQIALFLRHLWATDGCVWPNSSDRGPKARIYYGTSSRQLAEDVQALLVRLEVRSSISSTRKHHYSPSYNVNVTGAADQLRFVNVVGGIGDRADKVTRVRDVLTQVVSAPNLDTIPSQVWEAVRSRMSESGVSHREMARLRGTTYGGTSHFKFSPSRTMLKSYAVHLEDRNLAEIADSDVFWDEVVSIEPDGSADVYDMTVPGTHNFIANGMVVHNSIEQDSDMVMFIYRDEVYNPDSDARGEAELIIAKHRNGPTGTVRLAFMNQYTKFASIAKGL